MKRITKEELCALRDTEGLIIQGCGGDLNEWVDGINHILTEEGVLQCDSKFREVSVFEHDGLTNLLFHMYEDVKLNMGKLVMWRIATHGNFSGTWLSDYLMNKFNIDISEPLKSDVQKEKPNCPLIGQDGNIFSLMGIASSTLKQHGLKEEAKEMCSRITSSGNYNEALSIIGEYVNITSKDEMEMDEQNEDFEMMQGADF